jgi:hypothetical protein
MRHGVAAPELSPFLRPIRQRGIGDGEAGWAHRDCTGEAAQWRCGARWSDVGRCLPGLRFRRLSQAPSHSLLRRGEASQAGWSGGCWGQGIARPVTPTHGWQPGQWPTGGWQTGVTLQAMIYRQWTTCVGQGMCCEPTALLNPICSGSEACERFLRRTRRPYADSFRWQVVGRCSQGGGDVAENRLADREDGSGGSVASGGR